MKKILLLWIIAAQSAIAYTQVNFAGKVSDYQSKELLTGAHVTLEPAFLTQVTDENGAFGFTGLKKGIYSLKITFLGYGDYLQTFDLKSDTLVLIKMIRRPVMEEELVISASRVPENSPATFTNIEKEEIRKSNLGQDIPFLLETTPGLVASSDAGAGIGYTSLKLRGTDITRINVTVNGIQWNDPESQGVYWVNLPDLASSVQSIQVQRGVGTSSNGAAAFGGSINIQTQSLRAEPYAEINSATGSFNTFKNTVSTGTGLIDGKFTFDGRFSKITSDGYIDRAASDLSSFYLSGGYFTDKTVLKLNLISGTEKTYQAWNGVPYDSLATNRTFNPSGLYYLDDGSVAYYENETDNYRQDHYQLIFSQTLSRKTSFNLTAFMVKGSGYYENFKEDQKFTSYGLDNAIVGNDTITKTDLVRRKYLENDFYGANFSVNYQHSKTLRGILGGGYNYYDGDHYGEITWAEYAVNIPTNYQWYFNNGIKKQYNLFGKACYDLWQRFHLFAEIQLRGINYSIEGIHDDLRDISQENDFQFINPKFGASATINQNHQTYFSFGLANREPTRNDFRDADPDNQPRPERLLNIELGHTYTTNNLRVNTNLYLMDYKDQLVMTGKINNVGNAIFENVPQSYRSGIEISVGWTPMTKLRWEANLALSENKIRNMQEYVDNWSPPYEQITTDLGTTDISFSPPVTGSSVLNYNPLNRLDIAWIAKYVGKQFIDNTSNESRKLDPYFVNDLRINYSITTGFITEIDFSLLINNILNAQYSSNAWVYRYFEDGREYRMDGFFPQAGINVLGGVTIKF